VFVCTHILTVRTQVFLFKANYGTAVPIEVAFFMQLAPVADQDLAYILFGSSVKPLLSSVHATFKYHKFAIFNGLKYNRIKMKNHPKVVFYCPLSLFLSKKGNFN